MGIWMKEQMGRDSKSYHYFDAHKYFTYSFYSVHSNYFNIPDVFQSLLQNLQIQVCVPIPSSPFARQQKLGT